MIVQVNMSFASYFPSLVRHGNLIEREHFEIATSILGIYILEID